MFSFFKKPVNVLEIPQNGDYVNTDSGVLKTLNNNDPLKLGRVLTLVGWVYPIIVD